MEMSWSAVRMAKYDWRGWCGHRHRTVSAAARCAHSIQRGWPFTDEQWVVRETAHALRVLDGTMSLPIAVCGGTVEIITMGTEVIGVINSPETS
jgi:hypothetical protein